MHLPISKEQHERLCKVSYDEYVYGSHLFKTNNENSDLDIVRVYNYDDVFTTKSYLPNINGFNYTDKENNTDIVWVTKEQFWSDIYNGAGTIMLDIYIFSGKFDIDITDIYTRKIILAYLGVCKRDITQHKGNKKKKRNAIRCLIIASQILLKNVLTIETLNSFLNFKNIDLYSDKEILEQEKMYRQQLIELYDKEEINNYKLTKTNDDLLNQMLECNNMKHFIFKK